MIDRYIDDAGHYVVYLEALCELRATQFLGLDHGDRRTYKRGCRGPLCRKAMRDYGRVYQRARFQPEKTRDTYKQRFDEMLNLIIKAQQDRVKVAS